MLRYFAFSVAALAGACNPHNTQDACNDIAHAYCQRIFDVSNQGCTEAADFLSTSGFASLNDCVTGMSSVITMGGHSCTSISKNACEPEDFSGSRAASCASNMNNLQCSYDWSKGPMPATPECEHICCRHSGNFGTGIECCSGTSHTEIVGGCMSSTPEQVCD